MEPNTTLKGRYGQRYRTGRKIKTSAVNAVCVCVCTCVWACVCVGGGAWPPRLSRSAPAAFRCVSVVELHGTPAMNGKKKATVSDPKQNANRERTSLPVLQTNRNRAVLFIKKKQNKKQTKTIESDWFKRVHSKTTVDPLSFHHAKGTAHHFRHRRRYS